MPRSSAKAWRPRWSGRGPAVSTSSGVLTTDQLPSPTSTTNRCASGQRSPLDPTEPWIGTRGTRPRLTIASSVATSSGRTPECPFKNAFRRMTRTARTTSGS